MRRAAKVDNNHAIIRDGLRKCGFIVVDTARMGNGFPDLLVRCGDRLALLEVKMPGEELTDKEIDFHVLFAECPVWVVHSLDSALAMCQREKVMQ